MGDGELNDPFTAGRRRQEELDAACLETLAAQKEAAEAQTAALARQLDLLESVAADVQEALGQVGEHPHDAFRRSVLVGQSKAEPLTELISEPAEPTVYEIWRDALLIAATAHGGIADDSRDVIRAAEAYRLSLLHIPYVDIDAVPADAVRRCRVCGCTDDNACQPDPCHWVEPNLCSACA